jgi:peptidoglycan/LPS O-acetylase OafA/YrhL
MKRLAYLDSLRGLAALYVLVYHAILVAQPNLVVPAWTAPFFLAGGTGVMLFFVVSAFSLCLTWPRHEKTGAPLTSYFISRFFRIAPLFYFMMLVTYIRDIFVFDTWHSIGKVFITPPSCSIYCRSSRKVSFGPAGRSASSFCSTCCFRSSTIARQRSRGGSLWYS